MRVEKTAALYIGGRFVQGESGLNRASEGAGNCIQAFQASVRDLHACIEYAEKGLASWSSCCPDQRAQRLFRFAELASSRSEELTEIFLSCISEGPIEQDSSGQEAFCKTSDFSEEFVRIIMYYAGFADKYHHLLSCLNPLQGGFISQSMPEPVGVLAVLGPLSSAPLLFLDALCSALAAGNAVIGIPGEKDLFLFSLLCELAHCAEFPEGSINFLSAADRSLDKALASHSGVSGIWVSESEKDRLAEIRIASASNLKRISCKNTMKNLQKISAFTQIKTLWESSIFD